MKQELRAAKRAFTEAHSHLSEETTIEELVVGFKAGERSRMVTYKDVTTSGHQKRQREIAIHKAVEALGDALATIAAIVEPQNLEITTDGTKYRLWIGVNSTGSLGISSFKSELGRFIELFAKRPERTFVHFDGYREHNHLNLSATDIRQAPDLATAILTKAYHHATLKERQSNEVRMRVPAFGAELMEVAAPAADHAISAAFDEQQIADIEIAWADLTVSAEQLPAINPKSTLVFEAGKDPRLDIEDDPFVATLDIEDFRTKATQWAAKANKFLEDLRAAAPGARFDLSVESLSRHWRIVWLHILDLNTSTTKHHVPQYLSVLPKAAGGKPVDYLAVSVDKSGDCLLMRGSTIEEAFARYWAVDTTSRPREVAAYRFFRIEPLTQAAIEAAHAEAQERKAALYSDAA